MPQQDKFKREIDRIGLALAKLLSTLQNKTIRHQDALPDIAQQLQNDLQINLDLFLELGNNECIQYLLNEKQFSLEHLKPFADVLYESAINTADALQQKRLRRKALCLYEYLEANAKGTMHLDVIYKVRELKNI